MSDNWSRVRLGDLIEIRHGYAFSGMSDDVDESFPIVVGIGNFDYSGGFRFGASRLKRYSGEYPDSFNLAPGDILLAMTCQTPGGEILGIPGVIPDDGHLYLHNQRLGKVVIRQAARISKSFLFQLFRWSIFRKHLVSTASGSKILHTSPGRILDFQFDLPQLSTQLEIAATLGALDDKIESSKKLISIIPDLIAAHVDAHLNDEEFTRIPVSSLARFINGGAYTKNATGHGRVVIRIAELNSGIGPSTVRNTIDVPPDKTAHEGDILMSWSGSLGVYLWSQPDAIINQHIFKVIPKELPAWLVHNRLNSVIDSFRAIAADKATTMGHIKRGHLDTTTVALPPQHVITSLDSFCTPLWESFRLLNREVHQLAELRDALLPELMSGRIRVPEAREAVEDAVGSPEEDNDDDS